jgi:4-amino-4-deoxy-L-arabinose transferase-like glycosyltransferase
MKKILGVLLSAIGAAALLRFDLIQNQFTFLSPDGDIGAYSLLQLKICLSSLLMPGLVLLFESPATRLARLLINWLNNLSPAQFLLKALLVGLVFRILAAVFLPLHIWSDCMEYDRLATNWLEMDGYYDGNYPTAYWPPGYPFLLSRLYLVLGHLPKAGACVNILLNLGICFLTYKIAGLIWGEKVARVTMFLLVIFPGQILYTNPLLSENLFTFLFLLALLLLMNLREPDRSHWLAVLVGGIVLGLATLTRAVSLAFLPLLIPFWKMQTGSYKMTLRNLAIGAVGLLIVVTPWILRNQQVVGKATIATNGGVNFYLGNNPKSGMGWNPPNPEVFVLEDARYEAFNDSVGYQLGWEYIKNHPAGFFKRGLFKVAYLLAVDFDAIAPDLIESIKKDAVDTPIILAHLTQMFYLLVLMLAVGGCLQWFGLPSIGWKPGVWVVFSILAYWCAVHFVFFGCGRFHFPIIPLITSLAALSITQSTGKKGKDNRVIDR